MNLVPARCERSREWVSLRLDAQLSTFEAALLERHLRRCPSCRAFAARATMQTQLLRGAALEQPSRPVVVPARPGHAAGRKAMPALASALVAAAAAAALVLVPAPGGSGSGATASPVPSNLALFVVTAKPDPTANVEVPRLRVVPATIADGPVHGNYSLPV